MLVGLVCDLSDELAIQYMLALDTRAAVTVAPGGKAGERTVEFGREAYRRRELHRS